MVLSTPSSQPQMAPNAAGRTTASRIWTGTGLVRRSGCTLSPRRGTLYQRPGRRCTDGLESFCAPAPCAESADPVTFHGSVAPSRAPSGTPMPAFNPVTVPLGGAEPLLREWIRVLLAD